MSRADSGSTIGVVLPEDWWTIDLRDRRGIRRSVGALVTRQLGTTDERAALRRQVRQELEEAAAAAAASGGRFMAVSLMVAGGVPISATMTVFRLPRSTAGGLEQVEAAAREETGVSWTAAEGAWGRVLRRVRDVSGAERLGAGGVALTVADYWFDPDDGHGLLLASFSTPDVWAKESILDLFDAVVATIQPGDHARPDEDSPGATAVTGARRAVNDDGRAGGCAQR